MSRFELPFPGYEDQSVCGWDDAMETFFAQVWINDADEDDGPELWIGRRPGELPTIDALASALAQYGELDPDLRADLEQDQRAGG